MSRWRRAVVAPAASHHEIDGVPMYSARFDEVLSFHEPGLAAVRRGPEAWHIDEDGQPIYPRRFARTFGYYEGLAAVSNDDCWGYIDTAGETAGAHFFAWCGNFSGGRATVRDREGLYFHITPDIRPAYPERWRYAGDYRHGIAVVQGDCGRSTHIDRDGSLIHGRWFVDLDVFHKGFARARDASGWMHVDGRGEPLYGRRFAAVEPFYNGQARIERDDGGLEVIDERGATLVELRRARVDPFAELSRLLVGHWSTDTISAAIEVGLVEALPATPREAVERTSLPLDKVIRLLRALGELGLVEEHGGGAWRLRARGEFLRADHPKTLAGAALEYAGPLRERWQRLPSALRAEQWHPPDIFAEVADDPPRLRRFGAMLSSYAQHDYGPIVERLPLRAGTRVVDAGGGEGALARAIVTRQRDVHVTVLERPEVAQRVTAVSSEDSITAIDADLLCPWPAQADLVLFSRVLHDWDDTEARVLLENARAALLPGGHVAIIELLLDEHGFAGSLCDLHLLAVTGGRERTLRQFTELLVSSGFELPRHVPTSALPQLLIAQPRRA